MPRYGASKTDVGLALGNLGAGLLSGYGRQAGAMDGYRMLALQNQAEKDGLEAEQMRRDMNRDNLGEVIRELSITGPEVENYRQALSGQQVTGLDPQKVSLGLKLLNIYSRGGKIDDIVKAAGEANRNNIAFGVTPDNAANVGAMIGATEGKPMEGVKAQLVTKIANGGDYPTLGRALLAAAGEGQFNNLGGAGVFNELTGEQDLNAVGNSAAAENNAQAANARASALQHVAAADMYQAKSQEPSGVNASKLQNLPTKTKAGFVENQTALSKIDKAIEAVKANPKAFGLKNVLGDTVNQRLYPEDTDARAKIAEIGAVKIHDLTGSAQGVAEVERTKPFVPNVNDTPEAILQKLENLRSQYADMNDEIALAYPMDEYKGGFDIPPPKSSDRVKIDIKTWKQLPMSEKRRFWEEYNAEQATPSEPTAGLKAGDVEDGYKYLGGDPADPNSWEKQ